VQPDFVVFSFYKMLGYPTGLGALLIRRRVAHLLNREQ
jgi:molybdenum cofactor sulfurtransferase